MNMSNLIAFAIVATMMLASVSSLETIKTGRPYPGHSSINLYTPSGVGPSFHPFQNTQAHHTARTFSNAPAFADPLPWVMVYPTSEECRSGWVGEFEPRQMCCCNVPSSSTQCNWGKSFRRVTINRTSDFYVQYDRPPYRKDLTTNLTVALMVLTGNINSIFTVELVENDSNFWAESATSGSGPNRTHAATYSRVMISSIRLPRTYVEGSGITESLRFFAVGNDGLAALINERVSTVGSMPRFTLRFSTNSTAGITFTHPQSPCIAGGFNQVRMKLYYDGFVSPVQVAGGLLSLNDAGGFYLAHVSESPTYAAFLAAAAAPTLTSIGLFFPEGDEMSFYQSDMMLCSQTQTRAECFALASSQSEVVNASGNRIASIAFDMSTHSFALRITPDSGATGQMGYFSLIVGPHALNPPMLHTWNFDPLAVASNITMFTIQF